MNRDGHGMHRGIEYDKRYSMEHTGSEWLLTRFDRFSAFGKAVIWGWIVFGVTALFDLGIFRVLFGINVHQVEAILFADFTSAVLIGVLVFAVLTKREELLRNRLREIGYLNHHVRNSLMVLSNAELIEDKHERLKRVNEATSRIRTCVEQISDSTGVTIDDRDPGSP